MQIQTTPYKIASKFIGLKEFPGAIANPQILAMLNLEGSLAVDDSTPWCSAFVSYCAWLLGLERSESLAARSWLNVGQELEYFEAKKGLDIVILKQKTEDPGASVLNYRGHVGFFYAFEPGFVKVLGGNQSDSVCLQNFDQKKILSIRRLRLVEA